MSRIFQFDSAAHAPDEAFALYRRLYAGGADVERTDAPFFARVRSWRLDRGLLFARAYGGVRHLRTQRVAADGFNHFVLHHVVAGTLCSGPAGAPMPVAAGQTLLLDAGKPMESTTDAVELITVSLARGAVRAAAGGLDGLHGCLIDARDGAMLSAFLRALVEQIASLPAGVQPTMTRVLIDLLSAAINPGSVGARLEFYRLEYVRREAVQRLIDARLADRAFGVADITRETGISRPSLYRLFDAHGGVLRFIQQRRLQLLRSRLDQRAFDRHALAELAPMCGFAGESHASRLFKQAFGIAPGAYRAASQNGIEQPAVELMAQRWAASTDELT